MKSFPPRVRESIANLVRNSSGHSVSVQRVISTARERFPHLPISDQQIMEIVSAEASRAGRSVEFDRKEHT